MGINIYKNKGMYTEDLINKTCEYYFLNNTAYISKRFLPIQPTSIRENKIIGILLEKSTVDYNGIYNGRYIDFEVKETNKEYFNFSNIKKHQENHLELIEKLNGLSFIIISFIREKDNYFIFRILDFIRFKNKGIKKINLDFCFEYGYHLKMIFPGILDLKNFFDETLLNK